MRHRQIMRWMLSYILPRSIVAAMILWVVAGFTGIWAVAVLAWACTIPAAAICAAAAVFHVTDPLLRRRPR